MDAHVVERDARQRLRPGLQTAGKASAFAGFLDRRRRGKGGPAAVEALRLRLELEQAGAVVEQGGEPVPRLGRLRRCPPHALGWSPR